MAEQKEQQAMRVDGALLRELAALLSANDLTEIEVEDGDRKIRVARHALPAGGQAAANFAPPPAAPAIAAAPAAESAPIAANAIRSPMVGTAYLSGEPGSDPFIKVGDKVKPGDTLLIIEAMKVMNPIQAPVSGTVKDILIADGQPVEFGEAMMIIQ